MKEKRFIPDFIIEKFHKNIMTGSFLGSVLFIDIVGFSTITRELMKNGEEGAEILSDIIGEIFNLSIDVIYQNNGFVATFAGDAFVSIFPLKNSINVVNAVFTIKNLFEKSGLQKTKYGDFNLSCRMGISYGSINWRITGNRDRKTFYFYGKSIDKAEDAQKIGDKVIIHSSFFKKKNHLIDAIEIEKGYFITQNSVKPKIKKHEKKYYDESDFIPDFVKNMHFGGEFREIVACFIILKKMAVLKKSIPELIDKTIKFGGYFKDVNVSAKKAIIVVYFGAPKAQEKMFQRALDFALECRAYFKDNYQLGLASGTVFSGFIINKNRSEYLAMGDAVNLAARLAYLKSPNDVLVDYAIQQHNFNDYIFELIGKKELKGFANKIPVYKLIKSKKFRKKKEKLSIVGRKNEIQKLKKFIVPLKNGQNGGIIYIHGLAGMGKTTLAEEFKNEIGSKYQWFYLPCDEILNASFNSIINFLKDYFDQSDKDNVKTAKDKFEKKFNEIVQNTIDAKIKNELIRTKSILGSQLNIYWKNSLYENLGSKERYQNFIYAAVNLIKAESLRKPLILQIEDAHRIDKDSLKILKNLYRDEKNYPFVTLFICRLNDDGTAFDGGLKVIEKHHIKLDYFNEKQTRLMINKRLGSDFSDELFDIILQKSEGNPFYIEQIILYLKENRFLIRNDDKITLKIKNQDDFKIPLYINEIITARIDRLSEDLKDVIKTASVIGKRFDVRLLSAMLKNDGGIEKELKEGCNENIWQIISHLIYIFSHSLIRESAYRMQLKKRLRELHKLAGETYIKLYKSNPENYYATIAYHFEKAENFEYSTSYYLKAANYAKKNYLNSEALKYYNIALGYKSQLSENDLVEAMYNKSEILKNIGKWSESEKLYEEALEYAVKISNILKEAGILSELAWFDYSKGNYLKALKKLERAEVLFKKANDKNGLSSILGNKGILLMKNKKHKEAQDIFLMKINLDLKEKNEKGLLSAYLNYANLLDYVGNTAECEKFYLKALELSSKLKDKMSILNAYQNLAIFYLNFNKLGVAEKYFKKSLKLSLKIGKRNALVFINGNLGLLYLQKRMLTKAKKLFNEQLSVSKDLNYVHGEIWALTNLAKVEAEKKGKKNWYVLMGKALNKAYKTNNPLEIMYVCSLYYKYLFQYKDYKKLKEINEKILNIADEIKNKYYHALAHYNYGKYHLNFKKIESALKHLNIAYEISKNTKIENIKNDSIIKIFEVLIKKDYSLAKEFMKKIESETLPQNYKTLFEILQIKLMLINPKSNKKELLKRWEAKLIFLANDMDRIRNLLEIKKEYGKLSNKEEKLIDKKITYEIGKIGKLEISEKKELKGIIKKLKEGKNA